MIYKPLALTGGELFENIGLAMCCPICGGDYVGTKAEPAHSEDWLGRGGALVIPMNCESGHDFEIGIGFHKGQSWMFTRHIEIAEPIEAHRDANGGGGWHR